MTFLEKKFLGKIEYSSLLLMAIRLTTLLIKFIFTIYLAKYLGFESLGFYGLVAAGSILAPSYLGLGLMFTTTRKAVTYTQQELAVELKYNIKYILIIYSLLFLPSLAVSYNFDAHYLFTIIFCLFLLEHFNIEIYNLLLNLSRPIFANILHFIRAALWIILFIFFVLFDADLLDLNNVFLFWMSGSFTSLLLSLIYFRSLPWTAFQEKSLLSWVKEEFLYSKIQYMNGVLHSSGQYLNHFIISFFLGLDLTGVYVFFSQVNSALSNLLQTGVIQVTRPKLVKAYKENSKDYINIYTNCLKKTLSLAIVMAFIAIPSMYVLIHYIIERPLAAEWFWAFCILLIPFVITQAYAVISLIFYSHFDDKIALKIMLLLFPVNLTLKVCFIYPFGFYGLVMSEVIVAIISLLVHNNAKKHYVKK